MKWPPNRKLGLIEKQIQAIPTWVVVLVSVFVFTLVIIAIRSDEAANLPATLSDHKELLVLLLEDADSIALVVAVILYLKGVPDRKAQKHYEAWRVIDTAAAAKVTTSYARYQALLDLHQDGVSLQWLEAPGANLAHIELPRADLHECNLERANLQNAKLRGANLQGANLRGANLSHAELVGANLQSAQLQGANLRGAELWKATLWESDLSGTELRWAELHHEQLAGARLSGTIMPDGSIHNGKAIHDDLSEAK